MEAMNEAVSIGDLLLIQRMLQSKWLEKSEEERIKIESLHGAFSRAVDIDNAPIVSYLLSLGMKPLWFDMKNAIANKAYEILQAFFEDAVDINAPQSWQDPPALALVIEDEEMTRWFLARCADPNAKAGTLDLTPLSFAVLKAPFSIIKMLFDHGGIESIRHGNLIHFATWRATEDALDVLQYILDKGPAINDVMYQNDLATYGLAVLQRLKTALHYAAGEGNLDMIKLLLAYGANPWIRDSTGRLASEVALEAEMLRSLNICSHSP